MNDFMSFMSLKIWKFKASCIRRVLNESDGRASISDSIACRLDQTLLSLSVSDDKVQLKLTCVFLFFLECSQEIIYHY